MQSIVRYISKKYAPRWLILGIDIAISAVSLFLASLLRFNFELGNDYFNSFIWVLLLFVIVRGFTFKVFKTYSGIIRFTSVEDGKRLFYAVASGTLVVMVVNYIAYHQLNNFLVPISILIIDFLATISLMTAFRIVVKLIYNRLIKGPEDLKERKNVVIYGAGKSGLITKRTIDTDGEVAYKLIGFFDDDESKRNKTLEGVNIFNTKKDFTRFTQNNRIDLLILSIQEISVHRKQEIIEWCLSQGIKVKSVPPAEKWINGELSFKQIQNINIEDLLERDPIKLDRQEIFDEITDQVVMVTGASGSIGSELVRQILSFEPRKIVLVDISETALNDISLELKEKFDFENFSTIVGDIRNFKRMEKVIACYRPKIIFHAAAYKHVPILEINPTEAVSTNISGTKTMADLAVKYDVSKFIMISTDKAVNPTNVMGASKRIAEVYIQSLNRFLNSLGNEHYTRFITTRFGNVLGSNGSVIPRFRKQIEEGGPVTVTHPEISRYFMTIPEACQLVIEAGYIGNGAEVFLFDMGRSVRIYDLARKMIKLSGFEPDQDIQITYTGLRPGEKIMEEVLSTQENSLPTHHEKIMIASVCEYSFQDVSRKIQNLIDFAKSNDDDFEIVRRMKLIVPEYKSRNSEYEKIDNELASMETTNEPMDAEHDFN